MTAKAAAAVLLAIDAVPDAVLDRWLAAMPATVQARAATFRSRRRLRQFVAARQLLATLLRDRLASAVGIAAQPDGRPCLTGADGHCSIAHSGSAVMAGFSLLAPIGVDIEEHRPRDVERLVMAYFHPREQQAFAALEPAARQQWFYRAWTRKEARAKASGEGLTLKALAAAEPDHGGGFTLGSGSFGSHTVAVAHGCDATVTPCLAFCVNDEIVTDDGQGCAGRALQGRNDNLPC